VSGHYVPNPDVLRFFGSERHPIISAIVVAAMNRSGLLSFER